jgi:hypothetical protein
MWAVHIPSPPSGSAAIPAQSASEDASVFGFQDFIAHHLPIVSNVRFPR